MAAERLPGFLDGDSMCPFFSVVVPCYRTDEDTLICAIESVLSQTFSDYELICVNDDDPGAHQNQFLHTKELYSHLENTIFIAHGNNLGANKARNDGVRASKGQWIAFLDADDYWDPGYLRQVYSRITKTNCALVSTPIRINNGEKIRTMHSVHKDGMIFSEELKGDILSPTSGICVKKTVLAETGWFDETLPARQDYDMWLRVSEKYQVAFCKEAAVTVVRDGHESISSGYRRHFEGTLRIIEKITKNQSIPEEIRESAINHQYAYLVRYLSRKGQRELAEQYLKKITGKKPLSLLIQCRFPRQVEAARKIAKRFLYQ